MDLQAEPREKLGKSVNALRNQGFIPAEFYGNNVKNEHIAIKKEDFRKIFKEAGENTVINLDINGQKQTVLIHDTQEDRISGEVVHVDFYKVRMDEKIKAKIPVEFEGVSPAVKEKGGILNKTLSEIEVEALPADLPKNIIVDVSPLSDLNQSIYVKDIVFPKGVHVVLDPEAVIVSVSEPLKEEEVVAPPSVEDVKVEGEEKKAERDAEKEAEETNETKT